MKSEINPNTLISQVMSLPQLINTADMSLLLNEIERLEYEAEDLNDSPTHRKTREYIQHNIALVRAEYERKQREGAH